MWTSNSPKWDFSDATYDQTAASFDNPDHVSIVIHNYRWRLSLAPGESRYDDLETVLRRVPRSRCRRSRWMVMPTASRQPRNGSAYAAKFSVKRTHRIIKGAGHNLPWKPPQAFADAVIEVDSD